MYKYLTSKRKVFPFNFLKWSYLNFSDANYKINDIKKELATFEKLLIIGNYKSEENLDNELSILKNYKKIEENYIQLKNILKEKEFINTNSSNENISYDKYCYDCIINKDYNDLLISDVIYKNGDNILCIGEGNLSFSSLLQKKLNSCNIVSTTIETKKYLMKAYEKNFEKNLKTLEKNGGIFLDEIDVENLEKKFMKNTFDIIVFNFPFVIPTKEFIEKKWKIKLDENKNEISNDNKKYIKYYKKSEYFLLNKLFYHLFKNSFNLLKNDGYLHLRINDKYLTCQFPSTFNLSFIQKINFYNSYFIYKSLKYIPTIFNYTLYGNINNIKKKNIIFTEKGKKKFKTFKMNHTSTLIFQKIK